MAKKTLTKSLIYCTSLCLIYSCSEPSGQASSETDTKVDSVALASSSAIKPDENYYPVPAPDEMFDFIKSNKLDYDQSNNQEIAVQSFQTEKEKAIAFGMYSTNLAYVSAYDDAQLSIIYYKAIKKLASELGIEGAMTQKTLEEIQQKLDDPDSLMPIINASYRESIAYLEDNKRGNVMAIVATSGWLESMHIVLNTLEYNDVNKEVLQRVADQKLVFGNLWAYLKKYEDDAMVNEMMTSLLQVRSVLASFEEVKSGNIKAERKGKKLIFGGGTQIAMTKEQYTELKNSIEDLRSTLIN